MKQLYRITRNGKLLTHVQADNEKRAQIRYAIKTGDREPVDVYSVMRVQPYKHDKIKTTKQETVTKTVPF